MFLQFNQKFIIQNHTKAEIHLLKLKFIFLQDVMDDIIDPRLIIKQKTNNLHNYNNSFVDKCYSELPEDLRKISIYGIIGNFKPDIDKHTSITSICITHDEWEAMFYYIQTESSFIMLLRLKTNFYK